MPDENFNWAERYETKNTPWDSGRPSEELKRVLAEHSIRPSDALEIGCGTGTNAVYLAQRGFAVTAVDVVPLALEQAKARAQRAGAKVDFSVGDVLAPLDLGRTFPFVFERGVYHHARQVGLDRFLATLERVTGPGSLYLVLAGNANDPADPDQGPPRVKAEELCAELGRLFEVVQLREFRFDGVVIEGQEVRPLGWSGVLRRKGKPGTRG